MSLGKNKNRLDIYSDIFNLDWEMSVFDSDQNYYYYYDYYCDYNDLYYCDCEECSPKWSVKEKIYITRIISKYGIYTHQFGSFVDMDSIYEMGTIYYRNNILNRLLGEDIKKTTIGDFLNLKNKFIR